MRRDAIEARNVASDAPILIIGRDSRMENANSLQSAAITKESVAASHKKSPNPEDAISAESPRYAGISAVSDPTAITPKTTRFLFANRRRRSSILMRVRMRCKSPSGGSKLKVSI